MYVDISSGAASAHLCSHFIGIRSGPMNKLLYFCRATRWNSGGYVIMYCKYAAGLIQAGCLLVRFWVYPNCRTNPVFVSLWYQF